MFRDCFDQHSWIEQFQRVTDLVWLLFIWTNIVSFYSKLNPQNWIIDFKIKKIKKIGESYFGKNQGRESMYPIYGIVKCFFQQIYIFIEKIILLEHNFQINKTFFQWRHCFSEHFTEHCSIFMAKKNWINK